jgi:hypothetical protein
MSRAALLCCTALVLVLGTGAASADQPIERWRCGPYHITIIPGPDYVPGEYIVLNDDQGFVITKNGRPIDIFASRTRMSTTKDGAGRVA